MDATTNGGTIDGKLVFAMEGGISISEDPHFRFSYLPGASDSLEVTGPFAAAAGNGDSNLVSRAVAAFL